jgi:hypothetical protein
MPAQSRPASETAAGGKAAVKNGDTTGGGSTSTTTGTGTTTTETGGTTTETAGSTTGTGTKTARSSSAAAGSRIRPPLPGMPGVLPDPKRLLWWGGLAALAAVEVIEWPVAVVVAAGSYVAERMARDDIRRDASQRT